MARCSRIQQFTNGSNGWNIRDFQAFIQRVGNAFFTENTAQVLAIGFLVAHHDGNFKRLKTFHPHQRFDFFGDGTDFAFPVRCFKNGDGQTFFHQIRHCFGGWGFPFRVKQCLPDWIQPWKYFFNRNRLGGRVNVVKIAALEVIRHFFNVFERVVNRAEHVAVVHIIVKVEEDFRGAGNQPLEDFTLGRREVEKAIHHHQPDWLEVGNVAQVAFIFTIKHLQNAQVIFVDVGQSVGVKRRLVAFINQCHITFIAKHRINFGWQAIDQVVVIFWFGKAFHCPADAVFDNQPKGPRRFSGPLDFANQVGHRFNTAVRLGQRAKVGNPSGTCKLGHDL